MVIIRLISFQNVVTPCNHWQIKVNKNELYSKTVRSLILSNDQICYNIYIRWRGRGKKPHPHRPGSHILCECGTHSRRKFTMSILPSEIFAALEARGLTVIEQSSFYKVARGGKAVYISKTKRMVTRVDIAGFDVTHPAIVAPAKKNGKVTGQVDMKHEDAAEAIDAAFTVLVNGKVEGTKRVKKAAAPKAPKKQRALRPRVTADTIDDGAAERAEAKEPRRWNNGDMEAIAARRLLIASSVSSSKKEA